MNSSPTIPELLAPGGDPEAVKAAALAGADAVYLGFSRFNARRRARNIEYGEFADLVGFAHSRRTRIYVTLNILFREDELGPMLRDAEAALNTGADGLIVQDYGAARLLARSFPGVKLHASTQMTVQTSGQILLLPGSISRVNLARELCCPKDPKPERTLRTNSGSRRGSSRRVLASRYSGQCWRAQHGRSVGQNRAPVSSRAGARSVRPRARDAPRLSLKITRVERGGALAAAGVGRFRSKSQGQKRVLRPFDGLAWRRRLDRIADRPDELDAVSSEQAQDRGYEQPDLLLLRLQPRLTTRDTSRGGDRRVFIETPLDRS